MSKFKFVVDRRQAPSGERVVELQAKSSEAQSLFLLDVDEAVALGSDLILNAWSFCPTIERIVGGKLGASLEQVKTGIEELQKQLKLKSFKLD